MANRTRREEWQPGQLTGRGRGGGEEAGWCSSRGPARRPACGRFSLTMLMLNSPLRWRAWRLPCAACRRRRRRWPPGRPTGCTPAHSGQVVQQPGRSADGVAQRSCPPPHVGGGSQAAPTHPFATRPPPPHSSPAAPCSPQPLPPPPPPTRTPPGALTSGSRSSPSPCCAFRTGRRGSAPAPGWAPGTICLRAPPAHRHRQEGTTSRRQHRLDQRYRTGTIMG